MRNPILFFLVFILLFFSSCELFESDEPSDEYEFELYANPTDGAIFKVTLEDGTQVTYFGDKDEDGNPLNILSANFLYPGEQEPYTLILDNDGLPEKILASNGTEFEFTWTEGTKLRIKAVTDDGKYQVSIPIDMDTLGLKREQIPQKDFSNIREGKKTIMQVKPPDNSSLKHTGNINANKTIIVLSCGRPVENAVVKVNTNPPLGVQNLLASHAGGGNYSTNIPHDPDRLAKVDKECEELVSNIQMICGLIGDKKMDQIKENPDIGLQICNNLSLPLYFLGINKEDIKKIENVCPRVIGLAAGLCEVVKQQKDLLNSCKLGKTIGHIPMNTQYKFSLTIKAPGMESVWTEEAIFDPEIEETWEMEIGGDMFIEKLITVPADPGPGVSYTVYATVVCIPEGGIPVTISVVGDDGFTASNTTTITENSTVSLGIPGGAENVRDQITVDAADYTWTITVVF